MVGVCRSIYFYIPFHFLGWMAHYGCCRVTPEAGPSLQWSTGASISLVVSRPWAKGLYAVGLVGTLCWTFAVLPLGGTEVIHVTVGLLVCSVLQESLGIRSICATLGLLPRSESQSQ